MKGVALRHLAMLQAQVHHLKLNVLHASSFHPSEPAPSTLQTQDHREFVVKSIDQSVWISGSAPLQWKKLTPHSDHEDAELTDSEELHSIAGEESNVEKQAKAASSIKYQ